MTKKMRNIENDELYKYFKPLMVVMTLLTIQ